MVKNINATKFAIILVSGLIILAVVPLGGMARWEMPPPDSNVHWITSTTSPPTVDGLVQVGVSWDPSWFVGNEYVATDPNPAGDVYMVVQVDASGFPIYLYIGATVAPYGYEKGDGSWVLVDWNEDGIVDVEHHVPPGVQSLTDAEWQIGWGIIDMEPKHKNPYKGHQMTPGEVGDCFDVLVHEEIKGYLPEPGGETVTFPGRPEAGPFTSTHICVEWGPVPPPEPGEEGFRTIGFWKHQCRAALGENKGHQHISNGVLEMYLEMIADETTIPELGAGGNPLDIQGMCDVLDLKGKQPMRNRALQQTLALWLNWANGAGNYSTMVDTDWDCVPDMTLGEAFAIIEDIINDPASTKKDYETAKDMADSINNSSEGCP